jgi:hypothetical protein
MPRGNEKPQLKEIQWSKEQTTINKAIIVASLIIRFVVELLTVAV